MNNKKDAKDNKQAKLILTTIAFVLIVLRIAWPSLTIDSITLSLVILASIPWLSEIIEIAELPGGWRLEFRRIRERQKIQLVEIETLKFLVTKVVTKDELKHLRKLASDDPFPFVENDTTSTLGRKKDKG